MHSLLGKVLNSFAYVRFYMISCMVVRGYTSSIVPAASGFETVLPVVIRAPVCLFIISWVLAAKLVVFPWIRRSDTTANIVKGGRPRRRRWWPTEIYISGRRKVFPLVVVGFYAVVDRHRCRPPDWGGNRLSVRGFQGFRSVRYVVAVSVDTRELWFNSSVSGLVVGNHTAWFGVVVGVGLWNATAVIGAWAFPGAFWFVALQALHKSWTLYWILLNTSL